MAEFTLIAAAFAVVVALVAFGRFVAIERRVANLARLEAKVDLLLQQAGLSYEPFGHVPQDVADALQQGNKILAIKRYRDSTGAGLKEAKDFVEEVQRRTGQV